jgi:hypothetical protein
VAVPDGFLFGVVLSHPLVDESMVRGVILAPPSATCFYTVWVLAAIAAFRSPTAGWMEFIPAAARFKTHGRSIARTEGKYND